MVSIIEATGVATASWAVVDADITCTALLCVQGADPSPVCKLRHLDISHNQLPVAACRHIAKACTQFNKNIQCVHMSGNAEGLDGQVYDQSKALDDVFCRCVCAWVRGCMRAGGGAGGRAQVKLFWLLRLRGGKKTRSSVAASLLLTAQPNLPTV